MKENKKNHFLISNEEVQRVEKELKGRTKARNVTFSEHGTKLSKELKEIEKFVEVNSEDNSLDEAGIYVFKVEVSEGEKIQNKQTDLISNGMQIKAVKNERSAIVTSTKRQFDSLQERLQRYTQDGMGKTNFEFIEDFKLFSGSEKNSQELQRIMCSEQVPLQLDLQLMFIPNLDDEIYTSVLGKVTQKVKKYGKVIDEPYFLSDATPVLRVLLPSNMLQHYESDLAIYRIEQTDFFKSSPQQNQETSELTYDINGIDINELPVVAVLDSGVNFPSELDSLIVEHWIPRGACGGDTDHGTKVASKVAFRYSGLTGNVVKLQPRARIIDCNILEGAVPTNVMIRRIQEAVGRFSNLTKVFNLSANTNIPIEGDEMSIMGYELDALQLRENIQFIVSAGNHQVWENESDLANVLDDDDSRVASPADSVFSIVVGAITGDEHIGSISKKNEITPYSRRGPGFGGMIKPDLTVYGATIVNDNIECHIPKDMYSIVLDNNGQLVADAGTSFTAPVVAGDFAEILNIIPEQNLLLAKALLYHNAKPLWDNDNIENDELNFAHTIYGRGLSSVDDSKYSSPSKVTFVRTGVLNRVTKERVSFFMPEILAAQSGRNVAKVSVTCLSMPPIDRSKGTEYLGAYIRASLKKTKANSDELIAVQPRLQEGRKKWDVCYQFSKLFSQFDAGDWQVWLELFGRWEDANSDVPYALVITIEDMSGTLDIYNEIESLHRYRTMNVNRSRVNI